MESLALTTCIICDTRLQAQALLSIIDMKDLARRLPKNQLSEPMKVREEL